MRQYAVTGNEPIHLSVLNCALRILISAFALERGQQSGDPHSRRGPGGLPLQLSPCFRASRPLVRFQSTFNSCGLQSINWRTRSPKCLRCLAVQIEALSAQKDRACPLRPKVAIHVGGPRRACRRAPWRLTWIHRALSFLLITGVWQRLTSCAERGAAVSACSDPLTRRSQLVWRQPKAAVMLPCFRSRIFGRAWCRRVGRKGQIPDRGPARDEANNLVIEVGITASHAARKRKPACRKTLDDKLL
ncbi:hypothetical protein ABH999_000637 [Bradyrhizobium yuanmingense]